MSKNREIIYLDELITKIRENKEIGEIMGNVMIEIAKSCKTVQQENFVELPYPLGTKEIYYLDSDGEIYTLDAKKIQIQKTAILEKISYIIDDFGFFMENFGKNVFLTKKEALAALEEMIKK